LLLGTIILPTARQPCLRELTCDWITSNSCVLSAVSRALDISTRLRWLIFRWAYLLAPVRSLLSLLCSPLLRAMATPLAVAGGFEALAALLTIKFGVVLPCDFGCPFLRCRKQSNVYVEFIPRVCELDLWSGAWCQTAKARVPSSAKAMALGACWLLLEA
jgi:hypothetical protein